MKSAEPVYYHSDSIPESAQALIGGKAWGLYRIKQTGVSIPPWAVFSHIFFQQLTDESETMLEILADKESTCSAKAEQLSSCITDYMFTDNEMHLCRTVWEAIHKQHPIAVRSSASDEDSGALSFAGQMETILNINDWDTFLSAIKTCWASLYTERAIAYRIENGIDPFSAHAGIIVQQMINAESAGVVFTVDPVDGSQEVMVISSVWGLGEGLVSGELDADTFTYSKKDGTYTSSIAAKESEIVYSPENGTQQQKLPQAKCNIPSLREKDIEELCKAADSIEALYNRPMDIEFAIENNTVYILQARPVTSLNTQLNGELQIWDNSNIVESYSGVTTPLTFSFIKRAYYAVYCQFAGVIGVNKKAIFAKRKIFENMLGLIKGRVYYNLLNWYRLIAMMPGFEYNKEFMEQMMGLQVKPEVDLKDSSKSLLKNIFLHLPKLLWVAVKMLIAHWTLPLKIQNFHKDFKLIYTRHNKTDFSELTPEECLAIYRDLEEKVLWKWKAPIINDFEAMIFYGLLKKKTSEWLSDSGDTIHNDLLCGEGDITSTDVITGLYKVSDIIRGQPELAKKLLSLEPEKAFTFLQQDNKSETAYSALCSYLEQYGVRSVEEMKLESIPMKDNPAFVMTMLQNYLRSEASAMSSNKQHEIEIRQQAEDKAYTELGWRLSGIGLPRKWVFSWILKNTRHAVRNRENQRFARTQAYSLVRELMRSIGATWTKEGHFDTTEDIFYMTLEEITSYIEGTSVMTDLKGLVALRRNEFGLYKAQPAPPDHIEVRGSVYSQDISDNDSPSGQTEDMLSGLGCCQGIIEAEAVVIERPDAGIKLDGQIMVARQTDPGWTVLFPSIKGLIVEKGSMLSHSAIVAREMGIPCVVGVKNATQIIKSGETVLLNGSAGTIKRLDREDSV